ncbi:sigma-70 family RNA polymerase sigma factor [Cyanobium sp. AMD-g]|uniref:sigma-70 family RNA polymerase sigma factor n=1 Tax=Cyanobium sp. AMD-g TaxID=2823699 RepID=UPI0020CEE295|nr:sigma-70 family RNA polymerase sigma factor [Cyanobium sp. AMD-g]MCP9931182.1 sigma-70 family RNA polymerase sigma factor [Cyanobium sp. AMD-g]
MSDCFGDYLRSIGRIPLLTPSEELHLGALVQDWRSHPAPGPGQERRGRRAFARMVTGNLRLVVSVCKQQHNRIRLMHLDPMDVVQAGNLGLIRAVERFLPERGCRFSTYGSWWIRQSVHRHLQETTGLIRVPPQMAALARKVQALRMASAQPLSLAEIGSELGESVKRLESVLQASHDLQTLSLDQTLGSGDGEVSLTDLIGDPSEPGLQDDYQWLHDEVTLLNPTERKVLQLRYAEDGSPSLAQIGTSIGMSKHKVQHVEHKALLKLRQRLAKDC